MVDIPLAIADLTRRTAFEPPVIFKNMIVEKDVSGSTENQYVRTQRAGLAPHHLLDSTGGVSVRAIAQADRLLGGMAVAVVGSQFYKFDASTHTGLMTVANDGKLAQIAVTNFGFAVLSAGTLYFYDTAPHTITIPEGETPVSICSWRSYVIVFCDTGKWYWLEPASVTIDPLDFANAESMPDGGAGVINIRGEVYFFGTDTMEVWTGTGDADLILVPSTGREWDKGLIARDTLQRFDNDALFVGNDGIVYRVDSLPQRISNGGIEEHLAARTGNPSALTYTINGHALYVLHIPGAGSWAYDVVSNEWAEYTSTGGTAGYRGCCSCRVGSNVLIGDRLSGKILKLDPSISTDDGVVFERAVSGTVAFHGGRQSNDSIWVSVGSAADLNVRLRWHDGPQSDWSDYRTKVASAPTDEVPFFRLGAAKQGFRTIEISTVDNVQFRVSSARANDGREN